MLPLLGSHLCLLHHFGRNPTHGSAMHTEAAFRNTVFELVQERDTSLLIINVDTHSPWRDLRMSLKLSCQRTIMRSKEPKSSDMCCDMVQDSLCDGDAVIRTGTTSEFIQDNEGAGCRLGEDLF